jgi:hypothetical protein
MKITVLSSLMAVLVLTCLAGSAVAQDDKTGMEAQLRKALVKVHVTRQAWQLYQPWKKSNPSSTWQRGVMVRSGYVLTTANSLADQVMIEVSVANSSRRYPASLAHLDYNADLALVKIDDFDLGQTLEPIALGEPITIDDKFEVWQIGSSELLERSTGHVQKVAPYNSQLRLTAKSTLSDSGNGQAVLKNGKLVGLVIRVNSSRQEALITAQETIQHYLDDYNSGKYRGFGFGPIWYLKLLRDDFRDYYQVPEDVHGVVISRVLEGRTGHGALEAGDVLAELGGHSLDDEGMFDHPLHGRLFFTYLLYGTTHPGDEVPAKIFRKGKPMDVKIPIRTWPNSENPVPYAVRDRQPPYMVVGGMVLLEMTRQHRGSFAISEYQSRANWEIIKDRKRIVLLTRVLPDASNKGLDDLGGDAIATVNGKKITELKDVAEALKTPVDGYHIFVLEGINRDYVIKADQLDEINKRIAERYRISEMSYLGEEDAEGGSDEGGEEGTDDGGDDGE